MSAVIAAAVLALAAPTATSSYSVPAFARPCAAEDSVRCTWDAQHRGNGEGRSFVVRRAGKVVYVSHKRAHELVSRWNESRK